MIVGARCGAILAVARVIRTPVGQGEVLGRATTACRPEKDLFLDSPMLHRFGVHVLLIALEAPLISLGTAHDPPRRANPSQSRANRGQEPPARAAGRDHDPT